MRTRIFIFTILVSFLSMLAIPLQAQHDPCATISDVPTIECEALVTLYNSTDGANWTNNNGWYDAISADNGDITLCDWWGLTCVSNNVIRLDLGIPNATNNLAGIIPLELGNLSNLQYLDLAYNTGLSGTIPPELGNLSNLQFLWLSNTGLSGAIPPELGNLSNLTHLYLDNTGISGAIPPELGNLPNLGLLFLNYTGLSGAIPPELGNLSNLRYLYLHRTGLSGAIPPELGNLSNLQSLSLSNTGLSGAIPPELGNLPNLQYLILSNTGISGEIPPELGNLPNLTHLWLHNTGISGAIPPELGNLPNLWLLRLNNTGISGAIPPELGNLSNLTHLYLDNTGLSGTVPNSFLSSNIKYFLINDTSICEPTDQAYIDWTLTLDLYSPSGISCLILEPPTNLGYSAINFTYYALTWVDNSDIENGYLIERSDDGGASWYEVNTNNANDTIEYLSVFCGATAQFRVRARAYNQTINQTFYSEPSNIIEITSDCYIAPPSDVVVTQGDYYWELDVTWVDNASNETRYDLEFSGDGGVTWDTQGTMPENTTYELLYNLMCETEHIVRVRAIDPLQNVYSDWAEGLGTTGLCPVYPPYGLTATQESSTVVVITWVDNTNNETNYHLERSNDDSASWTEIVQLPVDSSSYSDAGLSCGINYTYRVRAVDSINGRFSNYSNESSVLPGCILPTVTNPGGQSSTENDVISLQVVASDPEGETLTYSATALPAGLSIDAASGLISGTIAIGAANNSPYNTLVSVSDGSGSMNASFTWIVTPIGPRVTFMELVDAGNNIPVLTLSDGDVINLSNYAGGISIQALTSGTISQVQFSVNGAVERTESVAPYTIAGDGNGNYDAWNVLPGVYTITATPLNNPIGAKTITITLDEPAINLPPTLNNPGGQSSDEGDVVSLQIVASDPEAQPLTYNASGLPGGLGINPTSGLIDGTVATASATNSPYNVIITVSDGINPVNVNFAWTVTDPTVNNPPSVSNPGAQSTIEGNAVSLQIVASDPEAQPLTYNASGLPGGLSINPTSGLIDGTVASGSATNSPYNVVVTVSDGTNPVNVNFSWTVNPVPVGSQVTELVLIDVATASTVATLTDGTVIILSDYANGISIQANTSGTISQLEFRVNGVVERTEGVAPYTIAGDGNGNYNTWDVLPGIYTITAIPLNNPPGALSMNISIVETSGNLAPSVSNPGAQSSDEGDVVSLQIVASDPEAQPLTYNASGLPGGLSINPTSGLIDGTVAIASATNSPYNVIVTVSDGTNPVNVNFAWTVTDPTVNNPPSVSNPGAQSSDEGDVVSLQIVASDPEAQPLTYNASGLPGGLSINPTSGLIDGTVASGSATNSPYNVIVTVSDGTNPVNVNFAWTVTDPTVNNPPSVSNPGAQSTIEGNAVSLQIVASDPEAQPLSYSASGLPGGLGINPTSGLIDGTVASGSATNSPYNVVVTVSDGTNPVNVNFSWTVNPVPVGSQVTALALIDVASGTSAFTLTEGAVITLSNYPNGINIQALTVGTISQLEFRVNGIVERIEGVAPYAIAGDNGGSYYSWSIAPGSYTITATPLNNPSGAMTVSITIVN